MLKLGLRVSQATVGRYLRHRLSPILKPCGTFLKLHLDSSVGVDFFDLPTATFDVLRGFVAHAQRERVLITKHGKPAALVIGVEGRDIEDVLLSQDPAFWKLIEARRKQPTLSLSEVRAKLGLTRNVGTRGHPKTAPRKRSRR